MASIDGSSTGNARVRAARAGARGLIPALLTGTTGCTLAHHGRADINVQHATPAEIGPLHGPPIPPVLPGMLLHPDSLPDAAGSKPTAHTADMPVTETWPLVVPALDLPLSRWAHNGDLPRVTYSVETLKGGFPFDVGLLAVVLACVVKRRGCRPAAPAVPASPIVAVREDAVPAKQELTPVAYKALDRRWKLTGAESTIWKDWFEQPPTDMGRGWLAAQDEAASSNESGVDALVCAYEDVTCDYLRVVLASADVPECSLVAGFASQMPILLSSVVPLPASAVVRFWAAMGEATDHPLTRWLWLQILLLAEFKLDDIPAEALHAEAMALATQGVAEGGETSADWESLRLRLQLGALRIQGRAARAVGFRRLRADYEASQWRRAPQVAWSWLEVLDYWAGQQHGDAAMAHYLEAESLCLELVAMGIEALQVQQRLVDILRRRATQERGGVRAATLQRASQLATHAYINTPTPLLALRVAEVALDRSALLMPDAAQELMQQALQHALIASQDPLYLTPSLEIRLAVQLLYEALPGARADDEAASALVAMLQQLPGISAATWRRIVQLHLYRSQPAQACGACADAARHGVADAELLRLWSVASTRWAAPGLREDERLAWQENTRMRQRASINDQ